MSLPTILLLLNSFSISTDLANPPSNSLTLEGLSEKLILGRELAESDPDSAILLFDLCLDHIKSNELDSISGVALAFKSRALSFQGDYDLSSQLAFRAIEIGKKYKDNRVLYESHNNIGIDWYYQEDYNKAKRYFNLALKYSQKLEERKYEAHSFNNLGLVAFYQGEFELELEMYKKALALFSQMKEQEGLGNAFMNIGTVYTARGEFAEADEYIRKALKVYQNIGYQSAIGNAYQSLSENYLEMKDYDRALNEARKALDIFKLNQNKYDLAYSYDLIMKIYRATENYSRAYEYQEKYINQYKEIYNEEKAALNHRLDKKYETAKKEAEIERLKLENDLKDANLARATFKQYLIVAIAFFIIAMVITIYFFRSKRLRAEQKEQDLQMEALKKRFIELHASPSQLAAKLDFQELNKKLHTPLSEREFEALTLSIEGKTNQEISELLFISTSTVKFHLRNTYSKMGVGNRKEAFEYMLKTS